MLLLILSNGSDLQLTHREPFRDEHIIKNPTLAGNYGTVLYKHQGNQNRSLIPKCFN